MILILIYLFCIILFYLGNNYQGPDLGDLIAGYDHAYNTYNIIQIHTRGHTQTHSLGYINSYSLTSLIATIAKHRVNWASFTNIFLRIFLDSFLSPS